MSSKDIVSTGININGDRISSSDTSLLFHCSNLVDLEIGEGVSHVYCHKNDIESLLLPESIEFISCDMKVKGLEQYIGKVKMLLY